MSLRFLAMTAAIAATAFAGSAFAQSQPYEQVRRRGLDRRSGGRGAVS